MKTTIKKKIKDRIFTFLGYLKNIFQDNRNETFILQTERTWHNGQFYYIYFRKKVLNKLDIDTIIVKRWRSYTSMLDCHGGPATKVRS